MKLLLTALILFASVCGCESKPDKTIQILDEWEKEWDSCRLMVWKYIDKRDTHLNENFDMAMKRMPFDKQRFESNSKAVGIFSDSVRYWNDKSPDFPVDKIITK